MHGVTGVEASDGSLVTCGIMGITGDQAAGEATGEENGDAYCVKANAVGEVQWCWISGWTNENDGALSVTQIPGGGDLLVVDSPHRLALAGVPGGQKSHF